MSLTTTAAFRRAMNRVDVKPRRVVSVALATGSEWSFVDGPSRLFGYSPSIAAVKPVQTEIDPFTRETTFGETEIHWRSDGVARRLTANNTIVGKLVRIRIGSEDISESDFVHEWRGYVRDFSAKADGSVQWQCADALGYLNDLEVTGGWVSMHPVAIMRDILTRWVPTDLWDTTSFNYLTYDTAISHWNTSRWEAKKLALRTQEAVMESRRRGRRLIGGTGYKLENTKGGLVDTPHRALPLMQELAILVNGTLLLDGNGRLTMRRFSAAQSVNRHLTSAEFSDWEQPNGVAHIANRIDVEFGPAEGTLGMNPVAQDMAEDRHHRDEDLTSQSAHAFVGAGFNKVFGKTLESEWIRAIAATNAELATGDTSLTLFNAAIVGFSGARFPKGYRDSNGSGSGGVATNTVSITSNVATANVPGHWFEQGDYITTSLLSINAGTPTPILSVVGDNITFALTGPNGALADQAGWIHPQQRPEDQLSSGTREAYLMIVSGEEEARIEIVRATACVPMTGTNAIPTPQATSGAIGRYSQPEHSTFTIVRAQLGTSAVAHRYGALVYDITMAVGMSRDRLWRTTYGIPYVTFKTSLAHMDMMPGDFFTKDQPAFVMRGKDGADSSVVFEAISKLTDKDATPPHIAWLGAWVYTTAALNPTLTVDVPVFNNSLPWQPAAGPHLSVHFDASSPRFLRATGAAGLSSLEQMTVSFWMYVDGATLPDQVCPLGMSESGNIEWRIELRSSGQLRAYFAASTADTGSNYVHTAAGAIVVRQWALVVVRYDRGAVTMTINGVLQSLTTVGAIPATLTDAGSNLEIGADGNGARIFAGGNVAHVAIFRDTLLGEVEGTQLVALNTARGVPGVPGLIDGIPGLSTWYQFRQTFDDSRGGFNLAIAGSNNVNPVFSPEYPVP